MDKQVLLISPEQDTASTVRETLQPLGYNTVTRQRLSSGLRAMRGAEIVLMDLPDPSACIRELKSYHPEAFVIVLAERSCRGKALEAGAYYCLEKPFGPTELKASVRNAYNYASLREELDTLKGRELPALPGKGNRMQRVLKQAEKAAKKDVPVLLSGEAGTGREYVARLIHQGSARRHGPFVISAAPPEKFERQLFGDASSSGDLGRADGGTLFVKNLDGLDAAQKDRLASLLRGQRLNGDAPPNRADVRVICSANGTLSKEQLLPAFGALLNLPPLRERTGDILPLAAHFLAEAAEAFATGKKTLSKDAERALLEYHWPGNVGELKNTMTIACLLSRGPRVETQHFMSAGGGFFSVKEFLEAKLGKYLKEMAKLRNSDLHGTVMSEVEKALIELVLKETGGNQVKTAGALGITRTTLRSKIKSYRIKLK